MEQRIWFKVHEDTGERWAMILAEAIKEKSITQTNTMVSAIYNLLDKIHNAQLKHEYSIYISTDEADVLFQCLNNYFYDYACSPFDKPRCLYIGWNGGTTRRYPKMQEVYHD